MKTPKKFPKMKVKSTKGDAAKVKSPVKAHVKKGTTRPPRQAATMPVQATDMTAIHDPAGDLHTMKRAQEIKSNPSRHKAAVSHGKNEIKHLMKITTSDR